MLSPARTRRLPSTRAFRRACTQDPAVQARTDTVTTTPAMTVLWWRTVVTVRVTYVSPPKKAKVNRPRLRMVAGSPRLALSVPWGRRRRSDGTPISSPANAKGIPGRTSCDASPARTRAAPEAVRSASRILCSSAGSVSGGPSLMSAGRAKVPVMATKGTRPRKTQRQLNRWATSAARAGPTKLGATQAVDMIAIMRARSSSGRPRPMATYATAGTAPAPRPWRDRPTTRMGMEGAAPATTRPVLKSTSPAI